ncbi:MAG: class I SAM-dependent methyltransferase [Candidatus Electrothrix aestuarii]|uniref:Class I SAM-dependent methyltransferase n=1 Tax=Candidatus Electrothrix aestuarii TaxID=3062594 RepID=A0AAU8LZG0_9BACT|nr:class I SAM-dependent methyltransferase [Candidatus Electrothrix aestuarii]
MKYVKEPIKTYWNKRSSSYGLDKDKSSSIAETWSAVLHDLVENGAGKKALDVGTGTGQFAVYLANKGFEVTGVDLSEEMIATARQNAAQEGLPIRFQTGDAEHLDFADESFDVVVSRNLLWTLPHPDLALKEWQRVLKPGGKLVVSDGFWMNSTWKSVPRLAMNMFRERFSDTSRRSMHFFWSYSKVKRSLPFYAGLNASDAVQLLEQASFKEIGCYDTACFATHPYQKHQAKPKEPSFFIVHAGK